MRMTMLLAAAALGVGCSAGPEGTTATTTPPPSAAEAPTGVALRVQVVDEAGGAVAGAMVSLAVGGAEPAERAAGTDGSTTFERVDLGAFAAGVTAYAPGRRMTSIVGVTPAVATRGPLRIVLPRVEAPDVVSISGTIKGKIEETNYVTLSAPRGASIFEGTTSAWSLKAAKGRPIVIVAVEWARSATPPANGSETTKFRWVRWDFPASAVTDGATLDLDFAVATPLAPTKVSVTMKPPTGFGSLPGVLPYWGVASRETRQAFVLGARSRVAPDPASLSYALAGEYVQLGDIDEHPFTNAYFPGLNGESSAFEMDGEPADGSTLDAFLPYAPSAQTTPLGGDVSLAGLDARVTELSIAVTDRIGPLAHVVWTMTTAPGEPIPLSVAIPRLPAGAAATLPPSPMARITASAAAADGNGKWISTGMFFPLAR